MVRTVVSLKVKAQSDGAEFMGMFWKEGFHVVFVPALWRAFCEDVEAGVCEDGLESLCVEFSWVVVHELCHNLGYRHPWNDEGWWP